MRTPCRWRSVIAAFALSVAGCHHDQGVAGLATVSTTPLAGSADALTVDVRALRWRWDFTLPDGNWFQGDELVIPAGQTVALRLVTVDVTHRMDVPGLGVDVDVVPGHATNLWLQVSRPGVFVGRCHDDCGQHPRFFPTVRVVAPNDFAARRAGAHRMPAGLTPAGPRQ